MKNNIVSKNTVNWKVLLVLLVMTKTILWTSQDTRFSKTAKNEEFFLILFTKTIKKRFYSIKIEIPCRN